MKGRMAAWTHHKLPHGEIWRAIFLTHQNTHLAADCSFQSHRLQRDSLKMDDFHVETLMKTDRSMGSQLRLTLLGGPFLGVVTRRLFRDRTTEPIDQEFQLFPA